MGLFIMAVLLLYTVISIAGAFSGIGSGSLSGILTASYLAEDSDIDNAELVYSEWETGLLQQIANTKSLHQGYDEYRFNVGEISHNPYELMAYLTVKHRNFSYDTAVADLLTIFDEQYTLSSTASVETRYRSVTKTNPETGESYTTQESYSWHILTTTLTARSLSDIVMMRLEGGEYAHYALLLQTKGSRQYIDNPFDFDWLPYVTSYYGYRIHPISGNLDLHRGVDIGVPRGTLIRSGQDGTVTFAGSSGDYGNVVIIEGNKGLLSKYAHCDTLFVVKGQSIKTGDVIAAVGSTGNSTGPHLHLEVMKDGIYINPLFYANTGNFSSAPEYGNPGAPMGDGSYAALIAEAEKHLGLRYVFGGFSPVTGFDCSGFVSHTLVFSGVKDVGRLTAQGLYNICTPVLPRDARPGDVIFLTGTYSAPYPVTHVAIYVGGGRAINCGDPISYTSTDTAYWKRHFYAFGRVN
jgi:murein DD-endopeptidase MepM/ murein hydrolase activator NlpD